MRYIGYARFAVSVAVVAGIVFAAMNVKASVEEGANEVAAFFMPTPTPTTTSTGTPTPIPTSTTTATATSTFTPLPSATATPRATPTETVAPTQALPATVTPTPTPTPTLAPRFVAPQLIGPPDGEIIVGREQFLVLSWEPVGTLAEDEWYAVRLSWSEDGTFSQRGGTNVKETSWQIPADFYWGKADQETGRAYEWFVYVERVTEAEDGQKVGEPVSPRSEKRVVYWQ